MSKKNLDKKNRFRSDVIAFRVSKAERYALDERYLLSGYQSKQDYLIDACVYNAVTIKENNGLILRFKKNLDLMSDELKKKNVDDVRMEIFEPLQTMIDIMNAYKIRLDEVQKNE